MASFVSVFSGAGGLDLGLQAAGWRPLYATDFDRAAVETLTSNTTSLHPDIVIERADIREVDGDHILSRIGQRRGDVELLAGGPPCQSWSSAGHQKGFDDPRGRLFEDYLRVARDLDVRWLLFENVRGLITARGSDGVAGSALSAIRRALFDAGWQTRVELVNAADYGVPQRRVRVILVGYRQGDEPSLPSPTHSERDRTLVPWVSLEQCLSSIPPVHGSEVIRPSGKLAQQLELVPPGSGVKSPGKQETTRPGGHWGYKQGAFVADVRRPARTVTASSQQDWIRDPVHGLRRLTPRECAAIQTFPLDWLIHGRPLDQYRQIGNAVPPLLAKHIGAALLAHVHSSKQAPPLTLSDVSPLPSHLEAAVRYTLKEEARNGASRRAAPTRRRIAA